MLTNLRNKKFLHDYAHFVSINLNRLQHEIGMKKKSLIEVYKALKKKIKKEEDTIVEGPTMDEIVKSVILSKSMMQPVLKAPNPQMKETLMAESMLQSEWEPAQSYFTDT